MTANQDNTSQTTVNQDSPASRDSLQVQNTDQPATHLTNKLFNGENYSGWSRQVRLALAAKQKLGFINGLCTKPTDPTLQEQWLRSDSMVFCWLLNSVVTEISSTLLYSNSSKELWDEIKERYGQSNGPLIFQLKREISNTSQGNDSIPMYYSKVKRTWDMIQSHREGEAYAINRQYHRESEAYVANRHDSKRIKTSSFCEHCKMKGHNIEQCFKIVGYPDWLKDNKKGKGKSKKFVAHANNENEVYEEYEDPLHHNEKGVQPDQSLVNAVCQEVLKALQKRTSSSSNYAHTHKPGGSYNHDYDDFSGPCY